MMWFVEQHIGIGLSIGISWRRSWLMKTTLLLYTQATVKETKGAGILFKNDIFTWMSVGLATFPRYGIIQTLKYIKKLSK